MEGYLFAGAILKKAGSKKLFADFHRLASTQSLLRSLSERTGLPNEELVKKVMVGCNNQRGTWIHPDLEEHLRRWAEKLPPSGFTRREVEFNKQLRTIFENIALIEFQFPVGTYRIDAYFPDKKIAVEYDEAFHERTITNDEQRQSFIEQELGCVFVRVKEGKELAGINQVLLTFLSR